MRVAAYIRVSTDRKDQENSYELQEQYFMQLLSSHAEWQNAGIYADYGISGTGISKRSGFRSLLLHCQEGKIDRIVCKSISRFARNTEDFLTAMRILQDNQVTVFFEKENLDTREPISEFIFTTLGALAQEESRSISENGRLANQMRFSRGDVGNKLLYGYHYNGKTVTSESGFQYKDIEIVEEEAEVVRWIFCQAAKGKAYADLARRLNVRQIPAPESDALRKRRQNARKGQLKSCLEEGWTAGRISAILKNERYAGDVLAQKTYTTDYLTHRVRKNFGEIPRYSIRNHHPAIIDRKLFNKVQEITAHNSRLYDRKGKKTMYTFSGRLICGECGRFYNVRNTKKSSIWYCPSAGRKNGKLVCHARPVYEKQLDQIVSQTVVERFFGTGIFEREEPLYSKNIRPKQKFKAFFEEMRERLLRVQDMEFVERDRSFYQRQLTDLEEETEKAEQLFKEQAYFETYWRELEESRESRKEAVDWLEKLDSVELFLEGVSGNYCEAFILSVIIENFEKYSKYTVHWFDDTRTIIEKENEKREGKML